MTLSALLTEYIEEHGMSQRELGRRCDITGQTISNLIRGINSKGDPFQPDTSTLEKLSRGTGIPMYKLMGLWYSQEELDEMEHEIIVLSKDPNTDKAELDAKHAQYSAAISQMVQIMASQAFATPQVNIISRNAWQTGPSEETMQKYMDITFPELAEERAMKEYKQEVIMKYISSLSKDEKLEYVKSIMDTI